MCHQTVSLVAREIEAAGLPTVVIANARDIVERCGVPRLLFVDFPLGNPCGAPGDRVQQTSILEMALTLLESAQGPRTTVQAPLNWPGGDDWKRLIFSDEQPFLEGEAHDNWLAAKAEYKRRNAASGPDTAK